ncbi:MAG: TIGR02147 family protein [Fibrobacteres bacterium]|nr:TIGR02147 family protein [Fibrobacterota bacterium]
MEKFETYTNYRLFLRDFYISKKKKNPRYSYRTFCKAAGITSPSLYSEIAEGKRNLTSSYLPAFIKGLKLTEAQGRFFTALVNYNQASTDKEKVAYLEQPVLVSSIQYEYYSKWYHSAIRELACTLDWQDDYKKLAKMLSPRITVKEARKSIKLLLQLGLIKKSENGRYKQENPLISTGMDISSLAVRKLNDTLSTLGREAIERYQPTERNITSMIAGVSDDSYPLIIKEINEFYQRIMSIVSADNKTNRVYNINLQLFPLTSKY